MRTIRRLILLACVAAIAAAAAPPAQATCNPGRISAKPLVVELPQCYPPGGGPGGG